MILLDLSAAFDMVYHNILLEEGWQRRSWSAAVL